MLHLTAMFVSLADHAAIPGLTSTHHHMYEEVNTRCSGLYGQPPPDKEDPRTHEKQLAAL